MAHREVESYEHLSTQLKKVLVETAEMLPKGGDIRRKLLALKTRLERDWRKIQPQLAALAKSLVAYFSLHKTPESQGTLDSRSTDSRQSGSTAFGLNAKDEKPWVKYSLDEDKAKFKLGSVKASIFHVLLEAGPKGLSVSQIVATTQALGLKDWTGVATPKCTVSGSSRSLRCPTTAGTRPGRRQCARRPRPQPPRPSRRRATATPARASGPRRRGRGGARGGAWSCPTTPPTGTSST